MITYGDYLIDNGDNDITPEQEAELGRDEVIELARIILAAGDINSLPNDMGLIAICRTRVADLLRQFDLADKYKQQVIDTCRRAEKAEAERDEHLRLKNELVLKAYRAMDAVDRIKAWIGSQKYENDLITVTQLRELVGDA